MPEYNFDPADLLAVGVLTTSDLSRTKTVLAQSRSGLYFAIALVENSILGGDLSAADATVIRKEMGDAEVRKQTEASPVDALRLAAGFVLASPEFQRH